MRLIKIGEMSKLMGKNNQTVRSYCKKGLIPYTLSEKGRYNFSYEDAVEILGDSALLRSVFGVDSDLKDLSPAEAEFLESVIRRINSFYDALGDGDKDVNSARALNFCKHLSHRVAIE